MSAAVYHTHFTFRAVAQAGKARVASPSFWPSRRVASRVEPRLGATQQTLLAAAGHDPDPGPGRARLRIDGVGMSRMEGQLTRYVVVWDAISLSGASIVLRNIRITRAVSDLPPSSGGPRPGRVRVIRDRPPARAGTVNGPAHPSRRTRWEERRRGAPPAGVPAAPTATEAVRPELARLAGRSITEGGWVGSRKIESRATTRGVRRVAWFAHCRSVPIAP